MSIAAVLLISADLPAQDTTATPNPAGCEIHLWPASRFNTLTEGAIWNNTLDSAFTPHGGRVRERVVPASGPLDPPGQLALLAALDLPKLLHNPGAKIILHDAESKRRAIGVPLERQVPSTSPCYMEVTVAKNFYNRSQLTQSTLRTLFVLDDYRDQSLPTRSFVTWGSTALLIFPAKLPENAAAADQELAAAFQSNARKFGQYAFAPPRKK